MITLDGWKEFSVRLNRFQKSLRRNADILNKFVPCLQSFSKKKFDNANRVWQKTKPFTVLFRATTPDKKFSTISEMNSWLNKKNHQTLCDTGALRDSLTKKAKFAVARVSEEELIFGTRHPYASAIDLGLAGKKQKWSKAKKMLFSRLENPSTELIEELKKFTRSTPSKMPARPLLNLSKQEEKELIKVFCDEIEKKLERAFA